MTEAPKRIKLSRAKGWRKPEGCIVVARPSRWGNPYPVKRYGEVAVEMFADDLQACIDRPWLYEDGSVFRIMAESLEELRGHDLGCWCKLWWPCHADVLLRIANA